MFKIFIISIFLVINIFANEVYILPKQGEQIKDKISESITNAKSEILIAMYNFSYKKFAKDLVEASKNGVKITVFLDSKKVKEDSDISDYLKKNNIKVVLMKDKMHLKLAIIDSKVAIFGSTNWTKESFEENYELIYISEDEKTVETLSSFIKSL
ncbi:phospholipase D-like domain-containing protein [Arcobacter caeni]|uniref:phospholipase D n=1 Tax=Arcobacter caeni TaxID=1912877 RepID=A0A363CXQ1_9BACT|nr:phospholipase D-like domain-containing protein [Arcobacter caeni]PUE63870.1 nuclease [Arcobacter caeni]